jgi:hypothetical protein
LVDVAFIWFVVYGAPRLIQEEIRMRALLVSTLALAAMASAAVAADAPKATKVAPAGPVQLTDAQLDDVSAAGGVIFVPIQGQGGSGFGGACVFCRGPVGVGGTGINVEFDD